MQRSDALGSALIAAAYAVALRVHDAWAESTFEVRMDPAQDRAARMAGTWPAGYCVEASIGLRDALADELPASRPVYVWGRFGGAPAASAAHAWVALGGADAVRERRAPILDVTGGQYLAVAALAELVRYEQLALALPGEALFGLYMAERVLDVGGYQGVDGVAVDAAA